MRALFSLICKVWFLFVMIEVIRWIWESGWIGKVILISMLAFGIWHTHFSKPPMINLSDVR